jgi:uncharacterized protein (TIGR02453 family)
MGIAADNRDGVSIQAEPVRRHGEERGDVARCARTRRLPMEMPKSTEADKECSLPPKRGGVFAFPPSTLEFLVDLRAHNEKAWFEANRDRYEAGYLGPAKAFVEAVAPHLDTIVPGIHAEPRVLGSIFRINRDIRFSTDKRPYKENLDFWFWEGERRKAVAGLFVRISPDGVGVGAGAHGFEKTRLAAFRSALDDELVTVVEAIEAAGYRVGGEELARTPRGFDVPAAAERFLRHRALYVHHDEPPSLATDGAKLVPTLVSHWTELAPLYRWLVARL